MDSWTWPNQYSIQSFINIKVSSPTSHWQFTTIIKYFKNIDTHQDNNLSLDPMYPNLEIGDLVKERIQVMHNIYFYTQEKLPPNEPSPWGHPI